MGFPMQVVVIDERDEKDLLKKDEAKRSQPILDLVSTKGYPNLSGWRNREDPQDSQLASASIRLGDKDNGISIVLKGDTLRVFDHSKKGTKITYKEAVEVPASYKFWSKQLHRHEKQHQYNKLFKTTEDYVYWEQIMTKALSKKNPSDARIDIAVGFARLKRRNMGIDSRARDEILAYVAGGTSPADTLSILADNPLYKYYQNMKEDVKKIPDELQKKIKLEKDVAERTFLDMKIRSEDFTPDYMAPFIDKVFILEYREDLKAWTGAISKLLDKGYTRNEVLGLLYQRPARTWNALVRRLPVKNPSVEIGIDELIDPDKIVELNPISVLPEKLPAAA